MKKFTSFIFGVSLAFILSFTFISRAGQWAEDGKGWYYLNDDGSRPSGIWEWIDGNGDGMAECYCFGSDGYCLMNTVTPDGRTVDASGAWTVNGIPQRKPVSTINQQVQGSNSANSAVSGVRSESSQSSKAQSSSAQSATIHSGISQRPYNGYTIVVNLNTKKFHDPGCPSVGEMKDKNKGYASDRSLVESMGYEACKRCGG